MKIDEIEYTGLAWPQNQVKLGEVALSDAILAAYKKSNNNNAPSGLLELEGLGERRLRRAQNVHVSFLRTSETPSISEVKNDYFSTSR